MRQQPENSRLPERDAAIMRHTFLLGVGPGTTGLATATVDISYE